MQDNPRILVINPNTSVGMTSDIDEMAKSVSTRAEVQTMSPTWGPLTIESEADSAVAALAVTELIWTHRDDFDGFVIACFDDPGLAASRSIVSKPVIGIAQAAAEVARVLGGPWGVIAVRDGVIHRVQATLSGYGLDMARTDVAAIGGTVAGLADGAVTSKFLAAGEKLVAAGATSIILACAGFGVHARALRRTLNVPVLDGSACAVETVIALLELAKAGLVTFNGQVEQSTRVTGARPPRIAWQAEE